MKNIEKNKIHCMEAIELLKKIPDESVDLVLTDPQYGWNFMGKDWDKAIPNQKEYDECFRILKPGAFMFWMSGARLDCFIENGLRIRNAGFKIDFTPIFWAYATGFPKAGNMSKLVDQRFGVEGEVIGKKTRGSVEEAKKQGVGYLSAHANRNNKKQFGYGVENITKPFSPEAKALEGSFSGFQPKPAVEIIIVAMKPLSEKTFIDQALKNNKGITWLQDCKIPYKSNKDRESARFGTQANIKGGNLKTPNGIKAKNVLSSKKGRFPANLLVSNNVLNVKSKGAAAPIKSGYNGWGGSIYGKFKTNGDDGKTFHDDSGSFSRYFDLDAWWDEQIKKLPKDVQKTFPFMIISKASKSEKNKGCDMTQGKYNDESRKDKNAIGCNNPRNRTGKIAKGNFHPTAKPIKLMSYLITLGSREKDVVVDPFVGSGTTAVAALQLGRNFYACDNCQDYIDIARARVKEAKEQKRLF